jgi:hypothetical protein
MEVALMTEMMSRVANTEDSNPATEPTSVDGLDEQLISQLVDRAKAGGLQLTREGGVADGWIGTPLPVGCGGWLRCRWCGCRGCIRTCCGTRS